MYTSWLHPPTPAQGSVNNTFGIKGVQEHCFFMKSIEDAHRLRVHIRCGGACRSHPDTMCG